MKYLLVLFVVLVAAWVLIGRRRGSKSQGKSPPHAAGTRMAACAHCGLHLPEPDALFDAQGRAYCGEEHRRLGAR